MYKQDTWAYQKSGVIFYLSKIQEEFPILLGDVDAGRTIPEFESFRWNIWSAYPVALGIFDETQPP